MVSYALRGQQSIRIHNLWILLETSLLETPLLSGHKEESQRLTHGRYCRVLAGYTEERRDVQTLTHASRATSGRHELLVAQRLFGELAFDVAELAFFGPSSPFRLLRYRDDCSGRHVAVCHGELALPEDRGGVRDDRAAPLEDGDGPLVRCHPWSSWR